MKIAIFSDSFYPHLGGLEDSVALMAQSLGERGHLVDIYVPSIDQDKEIYLGPNVSICRFPSVTIPNSLPVRLALPLGLGFFFLRRNRPDIIHTHTMVSLGLESVVASRLLKIPLVGTNHTITSELSLYWPSILKKLAFVASYYDAWFYNRGELLTAPSSVVAKAMSRFGFCKPNCVISNPIDTKTFSLPFLSKEEIKKDFVFTGKPVITFAGRFSPEKRVEVILMATACIKKEIPNIVLALAGCGFEEEGWRRLAKNLEIQENIVFTGQLSKPDLAKLFHATDVFVITSPLETQSMVTLQAMACGLPVVGVKSRALPEYVIEGETGYLVPVDDHKALAGKVIKLLNDSALRDQFGLAGHQVAERYSTEAIGLLWEKTYQETIDSYKKKSKG